jgi:membrane protein implicated in regulation of membrane protease activity
MSLADIVLDLGIDLDAWPWIWLSIAVAFALIELTFLGGSFVLLPFAASSFVASLLAFYDVAIEIQWAVFVFGGGLAFVTFARWARRNLIDQLPTGVGADRLVGMVGTVTVTVSPTDASRAGRVALDGEIWGAVTDGAATISAGAPVRVVSMRGTRVVIESIGPYRRSDGPPLAPREGNP